MLDLGSQHLQASIMEPQRKPAGHDKGIVIYMLHVNKWTEKQSPFTSSGVISQSFPGGGGGTQSLGEERGSLVLLYLLPTGNLELLHNGLTYFRHFLFIVQGICHSSVQ